MPLDYSALLYDPVYAEIGVPATFTSGMLEVALTVIDDTRPKTLPAGASADVRGTGPGAFARIPELQVNGIAQPDWLGAGLSFNGRSWLVRSYELLGSPNGEDFGEVRFLLKAADVIAPGGGYTARAVHFDGATSLVNDALVCLDNSFFSFVMWLKVAPDQFGFPIYASDPDNQDNNTLDFITQTTGATLNVRWYFGVYTDDFMGIGGQSSQDFDGSAWHSVIFSGDFTNPAGSRIVKLYFDDVDATQVFSDVGGSGISLLINGLKFLFGDDGFGDLVTGDFADVRIMPGVCLLDGNGDIPLATRRLFIDGNGKPVDPAMATAALGVPCILFSGDATSFFTNNGTGGAFTLTGTLANATTSPSDG